MGLPELDNLVRIGQLKVANLKSSNVRLDFKAGAGRVEANPPVRQLVSGCHERRVFCDHDCKPQNCHATKYDRH